MTPLELYVGQILDDKYRLERLLGQGGMGAVYLATHLGTERYVALKLIAPQFMRNEEFVERFKREARAARGYRRLMGFAAAPFRYDVVTVIAKPDDVNPRIEVLKGFWTDEQLRKRKWHDQYWD